MRKIAGRACGPADHRMILLSCILERGVEDALGRHRRIAGAQRVLLRSIEKT